jgi:hypothetical protein
VYISGKITGTDDYIKRFEKAENHIKNTGLLYVINPAKVNAQLPHETTYNQYIKMSLCMLEMCNTIYMLKGWEDSKGARLEWEYAKANNYKIIYE